MKIIVLIYFCFSSVAFGVDCRWDHSPQVVIDNDVEQRKVWVLPKQEVLFSMLSPKSPTLLRYQQSIQLKTSVDPYFLLTRQMKFYPGEQSLKHQAVIDKKLGQIEPMNCLTALLFIEHSQKFPVEDLATEFIALILERGKYLKIYFLSHNLGNGQAPLPSLVYSELKQDLKEGWKYKISLHNHPFMFNISTGDIGGTVIPSGNKSYGDVHFFLQEVQHFDLQEVWITNGFNTIRLNQRDLFFAAEISQ